MRLNQNPDLEIKTIIAKGEKPQTTDIILKVKERLPYHLGTGVDNQGTRLTGKYRSSFSFRSTNLTGNNDYLYTNSLVSADTSGESLMYILPLDTYGTRLGIDFTYFTSKLGREYRYLDRTGNTYILTPYFSKELYLSERRQTNISAGLEMKSVEKKARGTLTTDDQLRLPYIEVDFTNIDAFFGGGQNSFIPRATFGTDHFLGAGSHNQPKASRIDTGGCFFKYEHSIRRVQKMPLGSYLILDSDFQSTSDTLPTAEQFQLGGANSIRGYPEGDYLADIGARLSVDWVFPMYLIPPKWKLTFSDTPLRRQIEPVIFADIGGGKLKKVLPGERKDKFLLGLGGGLRVHVNRNLYARLEWAKSVGDEPTGGAGPSSFHLTFQFEI